MKRFASPRVLAALVAANAALVVALVYAATPAPEAHAGFGGGNYVLAVGQTLGVVPETVYIIETESGKIASVTVDSSTKKIEVYGNRELEKDLNPRGSTAR